MTDPLTLIHGDCVEVMRSMDEASADAIVTDPPYALGFMGKEWDRLGDIGQGRGRRPEKTAAAGASFDERMGSMPSFNASQNVRCRRCSHWRFSGTPCRCPSPDFPPVRAVQARAMQLGMAL